MDTASQKRQLRQAVSDRLSTLPEKDRQAESRSVCRRALEKLPKDPFTIAVFYPMRSEVDIRPLIEELLTRGCRVFMPRGTPRGFEFRRILSLENLVSGPYGILEPTDETELIEKTDIAYVIVPGMAFDRDCNRLGRGSGGYDKWLAGVRSVNDKAEAWGVALDRQLVNVVPVESHDQPMDAIVTPRVLIRRGMTPDEIRRQSGAA